MTTLGGWFQTQPLNPFACKDTYVRAISCLLMQALYAVLYTRLLYMSLCIYCYMCLSWSQNGHDPLTEDEQKSRKLSEVFAHSPLAMEVGVCFRSPSLTIVCAPLFPLQLALTSRFYSLLLFFLLFLFPLSLFVSSLPFSSPSP